MGTRCRIVVYGPDEERAALACGAAFDRIAALEEVLSDYRRDSEVSRLAEFPAGEWHTISPDLERVLLLSRRVHDASGGAFDPTVGPLTKLWRETRRSGILPDTSVLEEARGRVGFVDLLEMDGQGHVRLQKPFIELDFGGIGKGFAADEAMRVLQDAGFPIALIDFGGDVLAGEAPSDSPEGWGVEVQDGMGERRMLRLRNQAVATSGDLEQFVEINGVRYAHIIDPRTGLGLTHRIAATVIAESSALADALASAACVLGPERAKHLAAAFDGVMGVWVETVEVDAVTSE